MFPSILIQIASENPNCIRIYDSSIIGSYVELQKRIRP
jgi:hypothetical protein